MLSAFTQEKLSQSIDVQDWAYLRPFDDEAFWSDVAASQRWPVPGFLERAERFAELPWPELPQELYDEFSQNGNRSNFEDRYFTRRKMLAAWVVAVCVKRSFVYKEKILHAFDEILNEDTWTLPAHNESVHRKNIAADTPIVDLFNAETGMTLTTLWRCLRPLLREEAPELEGRIKAAVETRQLIPVLNEVPYWWLNGANNWTPWICANTLIAALHLWSDDERLLPMVEYLMTPVQRFIDGYHEDGACDEGPGYWSKAAGAMFEFLECLYQVSDGQISIFAEDKIKRMGQFVCKAHLCGDRFVNFADASSRLMPSLGIVQRFGQRCHDPRMQAFAMEMYPLKQHKAVDGNSLLGLAVFDLCWFDPEQACESFELPASDYMADTGILIVRSATEKDRGFIVAAKGGHNAESHNHNDVGHFMLYHDGQPLIIDVGVGVYTADTFNENRYTLWPINAESHNSPIINGVMQQAGEEYHASDYQFDENAGATTWTESLLNAYPNQADCQQISRSFSLSRGAQPHVKIVDTIKAAQPLESCLLRLVSAVSISEDKQGQISFAGSPVTMHYDAEQFQATIIEKNIDDKKLMQSWGETLWLIELQLIKSRTEIISTITFD